MLTKKISDGFTLIPAHPKSGKTHVFLKNRLNRIRRKIISLHPFHWFDGFMEGIKIDLKEFE
ncbi:MAG: hypothetical protein ABJB86_09095 [Bacteroidota bacterium]